MEADQADQQTKVCVVKKLGTDIQFQGWCVTHHRVTRDLRYCIINMPKRE